MGAQEDRLTEDEMSGWLAAGAALHKGTLCLWDLLAAHTPLWGGGEGRPALSPAVAAIALSAVISAAASSAALPAPSSVPAPAPAPALALAPTTAPPPPPRPPGRAERARAVASRLMVAYMLHLLIAEALLLPKLDDGDVTTPANPASHTSHINPRSPPLPPQPRA